MQVIISEYSTSTGEKTRRIDTLSLNEIQNKIYGHNEIVEEVILTKEEFKESAINYKIQGSLNAYLIEDRCFVEVNGTKHNVNLKENLYNPLLVDNQEWKKDVVIVNRIKKSKSTKKVNFELGVLNLNTGKMVVPYSANIKEISPINKNFFCAVMKKDDLSYQTIIGKNGIELDRISGFYKIGQNKVTRYNLVRNTNKLINTSFDLIHVPVEEITVEELAERFTKNIEKIKKEYNFNEQLNSAIDKKKVEVEK